MVNKNSTILALNGVLSLMTREIFSKLTCSSEYTTTKHKVSSGIKRGGLF